jgi:hypothetical protein
LGTLFALTVGDLKTGGLKLGNVQDVLEVLVQNVCKGGQPSPLHSIRQLTKKTVCETPQEEE